MSSPDAGKELLTASFVQKLVSAAHQPLFSHESELLDSFVKRRVYIEQTSLGTPRNAEKITVGDGGVVRVVSNLIDLTPVNAGMSRESAPLSERNTIHISVMNAGLFEATSEFGYGTGQANTGNNEIKLAAGLYEGEDGFVPDAIIFIKPEGINAEAYAQGQRLIGEAAAQKVQSLVEVYKKDHGISDACATIFDLTGYSEGSTQILSVAAALDRNNIGSIRRILSIGGAGFVGANSVDKAHPFSFVLQALKESRQARKEHLKNGSFDKDALGVKVDGTVAVPDIRVSRRPIETLRERLTQYPIDAEPLSIQKGGTKSERIVFKDDATNIVRFGKRLLKTAVGNAKDGEAVPWRRIKEVCTINRDAEYIAKRGIPTMVVADYEDPFFPPRLIQKHMQSLREQNPKANMWFVASTLGHYGPHYEQTTFSWLVEMLQKSWDRRMKTILIGQSK